MAKTDKDLQPTLRMVGLPRASKGAGWAVLAADIPMDVVAKYLVVHEEPYDRLTALLKAERDFEEHRP